MLYHCARFVFRIPLSAEYADGPTFVHVSLTEEEVEHISHMNRDAVCVRVVYLLSPSCLVQLYVCLINTNSHLCRLEQTNDLSSVHIKSKITIIHTSEIYGNSLKPSLCGLL